MFIQFLYALPLLSILTLGILQTTQFAYQRAFTEHAAFFAARSAYVNQDPNRSVEYFFQRSRREAPNSHNPPSEENKVTYAKLTKLSKGRRKLKIMNPGSEYFRVASWILHSSSEPSQASDSTEEERTADFIRDSFKAIEPRKESESDSATSSNTSNISPLFTREIRIPALRSYHEE